MASLHDPSFATPLESSAGSWTIDPLRSVARFTMTYLVIATLRGSLGSIEGAIVLDEDNPSRSAVTASIEVATLNTGIRLRDAHLRSSDFFDAERFPELTFRSARVEKIDTRTLRVVGDLTIRDITKQVVLETAYEGQEAGSTGTRRAGFRATTILSRREFGLGTCTPIETSGLIASDRVTVTLDISAVAA